MKSLGTKERHLGSTASAHEWVAGFLSSPPGVQAAPFGPAALGLPTMKEAACCLTAALLRLGLHPCPRPFRSAWCPGSGGDGSQQDMQGYLQVLFAMYGFTNGRGSESRLFAKTTPDGHGHDLGKVGEKIEAPTEDRTALHMFSLISSFEECDYASSRFRCTQAHTPRSQTQDLRSLARRIWPSTLARTVMESRCSASVVCCSTRVAVGCKSLEHVRDDKMPGPGGPSLPFTGAARASDSARSTTVGPGLQLCKAQQSWARLRAALQSSLLVAGLLRGGFGLGDLRTTNLPPSLHFTLQSTAGTARTDPEAACPLGAGMRSRATASATASHGFLKRDRQQR